MAEESVLQDQEDDIEALKKALADEKEKAESYLSSWQRERADFSNYKKRIEQEKKESLTWTNAELIKSLLPVVDDMERAFSMVDPGFKDTSWVEGFTQIQRKLQEILRDHGCTEIECVGQPFDPNLHEAVAYDEGDEGIVIAEHRKGYKMNDRVLRAPQVSVGKGKNEQTAKLENNENENQA